uniref:Uncharacterized protein n=1 Tax=Sus scrofa TaxID=9823 RepID=A0A8W4FK97_PIG
MVTSGILFSCATTGTPDPDKFYLLVFTDPGAPNQKDLKYGEWHHVKDNDISRGQRLHHYIRLVYEQDRPLNCDDPILSQPIWRPLWQIPGGVFPQKVGVFTCYQVEWDGDVPDFCEQLAGE